MEQKPLFVVNGGIKMPIGYRFLPTDEELVVHYLRRKELGLPLPASVIPELDVFQTEPWSLPGGLEENRYFFSRLKGSDVIDSDKRRRIAGSGYWKANGKMRLIRSGNQLVGMRRTLVFSREKHSTRTNVQWVMHELHLLGLSQQMELGDRWVIYRVYQKKRKPRREETLMSEYCPSIVMLPWEPKKKSNHRVPPQPSSPSCSSGDDYSGLF